MFRTANSVEMLKPIALIASLAILLWSLGLPSLRFADAANITDVSDVLSDSAPSAASNHTINFTIPAGSPGVANGETIVIDFSGFSSTGVDSTDIDLTGSTFGAMTVAANCAATDNASAVFSGSTLTITLCSGDSGVFVAGETVTLLIGQNATGGVANTRLTNPATEGSKVIDFSTVGSADSGATMVVIMTAVTVTATVNTIFDFTVTGLGSGVSVNGETSGIVTSSTSIPFGTLTAGVATTGAQMLTVSTNASNGYSVTVQTDGDLRSSTGATIDNFDNGSDTASPVAWGTPDGTVGSANTYGHWGVTSDDADIFAANEFIAASTSPRQIMTNNGPANGQGMGVGTTTVGYKVEITALQEAGDDYQTTVTYVATPTF